MTGKHCTYLAKKLRLEIGLADKHESFHPTVNAKLFAGASRKKKKTYLVYGVRREEATKAIYST
jgi:hypothetical protein